MKLLFVVDNMSSKCGANVNIILNLVNKLKENNLIEVLTKANKLKMIDKNKTQFIDNCISFSSNEAEYLTEFQKKYKWCDQNVIQKILLMICHPRVPLYMLDVKYFDSWLTRRAYIKEIENACDNQQYDVVIAVCAPYYLARVLADSRIECKKLVFQLDPYSYNYTMPALYIQKRRKIENKVYNSVDKIMAASFVYDDMLRNKIFPNMKKVQKFMLPGIIVDEIRETQFDDNVNRKMTINFMFIGQFYEDIRNPRFLLELFCNLPQNYVLHIYGGGTDRIIRRYQEKLGDRLVCYGWVDSETARRQMYNADVLVNVNNTIQNQLPSKLFEYIGIGKPILNICKRKDCSSLRYTENYSLCLDLIESEQIDISSITRTKDFVKNAVGKRVTTENILSEFEECTDVYVANLMEEVLEEIRNL